MYVNLHYTCHIVKYIGEKIMFLNKDAEAFIEANGGKSAVCRAIECTRPAFDKWLKDGQIPETCTRGKTAGSLWHKNIRKLGFDPDTLKPL